MTDNDKMNFRARVVGRGDPSRLKRRVFRNASLVGEDYSGLTLDQFSAAESRFRDCRFERSVIQGASFGAGQGDSEYLDCVFDGARLEMSLGGFARFVSCSFRDVDISHWICFGVELVDCDFSGARLEQCVFNGEVPPEDARRLKRTRNEVRGNDFSQAELIDVDFRTGIDLTLQKLPRGPDYFYVPDLSEAVRIGRAYVDGVDDPDVRENIDIVLGMAEENVAGGQRQALYYPKGFPASVSSGIVALVDLWSRELT